MQKVKIIQRQNIGELEEVINEYCKDKKIVTVNISIISAPTEYGIFADRNYHKYFYACIITHEKN